MISVTVNGRPRELPNAMSLPALIEQLEIRFPRVAVALNGEVLRQEEHATTMIHDGDAVEIVRMVGGG